MGQFNSSNLYHYGIKGMKWGVRRYQNKGGSYTKRGLDRYYKAEAEYNSAKEKQRETKESYKNKTATKYDVQSVNQQVKTKKKKMEDAYNRLKTDKLADEGKELYKKGKTISGNYKINAIAQGSIVLGGRMVNQALASSLGNQNVALLATSAIATGATFVNAIMAGKTYRENKRLRAYYAH